MKNARLPVANVVWLKKDLRLFDHSSLYNASKQDGPTIAIAPFEKKLWNSTEYGQQHQIFFSTAVLELSRLLQKRFVKVFTGTENMIILLTQLKIQLGNFRLFSHQETGDWASYKRDLAVKKWCDLENIEWIEYRQNNVIRNLRDRNTWSSHWRKFMSKECFPEPYFKANLHDMRGLTFKPPLYDISDFDHRKLCKLFGIDLFHLDDVSKQLPRSVKKTSTKLLESFLINRSTNYSKEMSSPLTAEYSCSRISPFLTWGILSIRDVYQQLLSAEYNIKNTAASVSNKSHRAGLSSFKKRLHWRCHFIQKLEAEPEIEFRNLHPSMNAVRNEGCLTDHELEKLEAWKDCKTGVPFVDACMNYLRINGWINFRMRAMLVSFVSHNLWIHWRHSGSHLANLFLDYEPGIHWPQIQMQSGTTGINTVRIYNPDKQMTDHDPEAIFTKKWDPNFGKSLLNPIVDIKKTSNIAKSMIYEKRTAKNFKSISKVVFKKHGSRKNKIISNKPKIPKNLKNEGPQQLKFFPD